MNGPLESPGRKDRPPLASEQEYQRAVIDAAQLLGWRVMHTRPAQDRHGNWRTPVSGDVGFPDLVLVHRHVGVFFRELKVSTELTGDQRLWASALLDAGADWAELRMPRDYDATLAWLADAPRKATGL